MEGWMAAAAVLLSIWTLLSVSNEVATAEQAVHSKTFHSPVFELGPGEVTDFYQPMEMPTGHIALRNFFAEVVDENDVSVPLNEVYLHHWVVTNKNANGQYRRLLSSAPEDIPDIVELRGHSASSMRHADRMASDPLAEPKQTGTCHESDTVLLAIGAETRRTNTSFPAPYGFVIGDPAKIPAGEEETWYLNIHAISTIDVVDIKSCSECLCEAYGVTHDSTGRPLSEGYLGGQNCCYDKTQCAVKEDAVLVKRKYFLKYIVTWVDWDTSVIPLRAYAVDVTDGRTSLSQTPNCRSEFQVEQCDKESSAECIDHHQTVAALPVGGDLIFARMHQHAGSLGGIIYDKDGVVLCKSDPIYGQGTAAGDEAGYLVGVTTCTPEVGTTYVEAWKELHMDAYYSSEKSHSGAMAIFRLFVADPVILIAEVTDNAKKDMVNPPQ